MGFITGRHYESLTYTYWKTASLRDFRIYKLISKVVTLYKVKSYEKQIEDCYINISYDNFYI